MFSQASFLPDELVFALGWTVLHSLWQASLVAIVLLLLHFLLRHRTASLRYRISVAGLFLVFGLALATFGYYFSLARETAPVLAEWPESLAESSTALAETTACEQPLLQQMATYFNDHLPLLVMLWMTGMLFFVLRLFGGLLYLRHLRRYGVGPVPVYWQQRTATLAMSLGIRRPIQVMESSRVPSPMVLGWIKPVILFPLGALSNLTPEQVEAVLSHELAHIRRHDFVINILQSVIEAFLYFNPAVWWISALVRAERENCCDDLAVIQCGDSLTYAKALLILQQYQLPQPALAMAAIGSRPKLLIRINRILNQPVNQRLTREKFLATCILVIAILGFAVAESSSYVPDGEAEEVCLSGSLPSGAGVWTAVATDTLPRESARYRFTKDGEQVEARIDRGKLVELTVDGEPVPQSAYPAYEKKLEEWIAAIPEPRFPPRAPAPPPASTPAFPAAPPAPPAPPMGLDVPAFSFDFDTEELAGLRSSRMQVITRDTQNGSTVMILDFGSKKDTLIIEQSGEGNRIVLDGMELVPGEHTYFFDVEGFNWESEDDNLRDGYRFPAPEEADPVEHARRMRELSEERRQAMEEYRQAMEENREVLREQMREMREKERELFEKHREQQEIYVEEMREENMQRRREAEQERERSRLRQQSIEEELLRDGLIEDAGNYKLELTENSFSVNGKKQPEELAEKYRRLFRSSEEEPVGRIEIRKSSD